jgi:hypothetical protein
MVTRRAAIAAALGLAAAPLRAAETVEIHQLYVSGVGPTDRARALEGARVRIAGFMAPPLRAEARFFVLTSSPMPVCPFCDSEEDWPETIIPVYTERAVEPEPFYRQIYAEGVLTLGVREDAETGFVSPLRLENSRYGAL